MKVSDIMTRRVVSVAPGATVLEAADLMLKHHVSGLPVVDNHGTLLGIVTEGDFLRRPETGTERRRGRWLDALFGPAEGARYYVRSHGTKIGEVMTHHVVTVAEDDSLEQVVHRMELHRIKRLPVVRDGKVVGIVSRANLLRVLASVQRGTRRASTSDAGIRDTIVTEIDRRNWAAGAHIEIVVRGGVADMWGSLADPAQRDALRVLVETTPGVKRVFDHLRWDGDITPS